MDTIEAYVLANKLMSQYGLGHWFFEYDRSKRRFGACHYRTNTITLSFDLVFLNSVEKVTETILHEISHGLVGPGHGHDGVWKAKATQLGIKPDRCYSEDTVQPQSRYKLVCPACSYSVNIHRKPKRKRACSNCCRKYNGGRYTDKFQMELRGTI